MFAKLLLGAGLVSKALAFETRIINVGQNRLTFTPSTLSAALGDILEFRFFPRNHSVVQGTWDSACSPIAEGGFFSGFVPTSAPGPNNVTFQVRVTTTQPIIVYCSQNTGNHCKNGMAAVINPRGQNNLAAYKAAAVNATTAVSPNSVFGGQFVPHGGSASSSASSNTGPSTSSGASTSTATSTTSATTSPTIAGSSAADSVKGSLAGFIAAAAAAGAAAVGFV